MFTLYRVAFTPPQKSYRMGLLFTDKDDDFGAISDRAKPLADLESGASHVERGFVPYFAGV